MKNENGNGKRSWKEAAKDKKFYLYTVIGCAVVLLSLVIVAVATTLGSGGKNSVGVNNGTQNSSGTGDNGNNGDSGDNGNSGNNENNGNSGNNGNNGSDKPVVGENEAALPVASVEVVNDYGFFYNQTLNSYYEHVGMDFAAEAGTAVMAMQSGVIESIYRDDLLTGTEIVIDHGDGLKSVYRFVEVAEGLEVGDEVERGQQIAVVAEANGNEYKDGAHLHFEILKNDKNVDPATYLTLDEK